MAEESYNARLIMARKIFPLTSRLLFVVLFATFLSPSFAWEKVASHGVSAHADAVMAAGDVDHGHEGDGHSHDHDDAAHGQIGHLLSHLPVMTADIAAALPPTVGGIVYPAHHHAVVYADPEPPYKPPRTLLFV